MSYDISLEIDTGGDVPFEIYECNITFNLYKMFSVAFQDAFGVESDSINFLDGMNAGEAVIHLERAIRRMKKEPDAYKRYDSPNGWGLYIHALPFLERWLSACRENPKTIISVRK